MALAAGGSGAGGGDRCPSGEKGTTPVGRRPKKLSAFNRAALRYLEKEYTECVTRGEEPPFDLEALLRRCGSSPPNPEVPAPSSSFAPARNPSEHSAFPTQGRLRTYVLMCKFLSCMFGFGMFVFVFECNLCMCC